MDLSSQCSFISPKLVKQLGFHATATLPIQIPTLSTETSAKMLDLFKIKVKISCRKTPIKGLVHDHVSTEITYSSLKKKVAGALQSKGLTHVDGNIKSDTLKIVELFIGEDYFSQVITGQHTYMGSLISCHQWVSFPSDPY